MLFNLSDSNVRVYFLLNLILKIFVGYNTCVVNIIMCRQLLRTIDCYALSIINVEYMCQLPMSIVNVEYMC